MGGRIPTTTLLLPYTTWKTQFHSLNFLASIASIVTTPISATKPRKCARLKKKKYIAIATLWSTQENTALKRSFDEQRYINRRKKGGKKPMNPIHPSLPTTKGLIRLASVRFLVLLKSTSKIGYFWPFCLCKISKYNRVCNCWNFCFVFVLFLFYFIWCFLSHNFA